MAENSQDTSIKNLVCVDEESENMPDHIQFPTFPVPIPTTQPQSVEIPPPQGKKIFILADHQKNVMSRLASLWKSGKLCDAGIDNGLSTVMVSLINVNLLPFLMFSYMFFFELNSPEKFIIARIVRTENFKH